MSDSTSVKRPTVKVNINGEEIEWQQYTPPGRKPAKTIRGALVNTLDVLKDEAHWMQGEWFKNYNPNLDPEDAFCNSWSACLDGILQMVTVGAYRCEGGYDGDHRQWLIDVDPNSKVPNSGLYYDTVAHVEKFLPPRRGFYDDTHTIVSFNDDDSTRRSDVEKLVRKAIKTAPKSKK